MSTSETADKQKRGKVGFYACYSLVRVMLRDPESNHYPRVVQVDCPRCGLKHTVHLSWRAFKESIDTDKEAILLDAT